MSSQLGNLVIASGGDTTFSVPNNGVKAILIGNESGLTVTISMTGSGVEKTLYPSTLDWFEVRQGFSGNIRIHPITILNNVSSFPASSLVFDAIGLNDPEQATMYPLSLQRNTNIGNTITSVGGGSTSVINDNQPLTPSNVFVESTPTGAAGSTVSIATDGTVTIKGDVSNVLTTLLQLLPTAAAGASSVILGDSARQTEILGKLLVDGATKLDGGNMHTDGSGNLTTNSMFPTQVQATAAGGSNTFAGDATFNGAGTGLTVTNNALVSGTLEVTGATDLDSTLDVFGSSTLDNGNITTDGSGNISTQQLTATGVKCNTFRDNGVGTDVFDLASTLITANVAAAFTKAVNPNIAAFYAASGSVSGTLSLFMPFQGSGFKVVLIIMTNYQDASNHSIALPTTFTQYVSVFVPSDIGVSGNGGFQLQNGATPENIDIQTTVAAAGGAGVSQATIFKFSTGSRQANGATNIDHVNMLSNTTAHNGIALLVGI